MYRSEFRVAQMDCPCEESLIRLKLQDIAGVQRLEFDLANRTVTVYHLENAEVIIKELDSLELGSQLLATANVGDSQPAEDHGKQRRVLWTVLAVNLVFFMVEMATGIIAGSMGLVADSLDMLADGLVYGLSLYAVGTTLVMKKRVAGFSGYFQILLAVIGLAEVIKRALGLETIPDFRIMIFVSILALIANSACLYILQKTKSKEAHIQASIVFSSNDVIINTGVIVAGLLVWWLDSKIPDLVIGCIVFLIVTKGALRILKLSK